MADKTLKKKIMRDFIKKDGNLDKKVMKDVVKKDIKKSYGKKGC